MKPAVRKFYNFARSLQSRYRRQKLLCHCVFHPLLTMSEVLPPKVSGEFIAKNAKHVKIHDGGIRKLAEEISKRLLEKTLVLSGFSQVELHPKELNEEGVNWIFVIDTLNFCFWSPASDNKWTVTYQGKPYTGYFALCAAVNRALDEGYKITTPSYYSQITEKDLAHILRGDEGCPSVALLKERRQCLHQVGLALIEKYDGKFSQVIEESKHSAVKLLDLIVNDFECFRDEAVYCEKRVGIYKRAQILIGDIWACGRGKDLGQFDDIFELTMFADYRVPQVLVDFGAMSYSTELEQLLKKDTLLKNGSVEEVEIRGVSIEVVERVLVEVKKMIPEVTSQPSEDPEKILCNSILIDHFLWDYRRAHAAELEHIPFHKTLSIYY